MRMPRASKLAALTNPNPVGFNGQRVVLRHASELVQMLFGDDQVLCLVEDRRSLAASAHAFASSARVAKVASGRARSASSSRSARLRARRPGSEHLGVEG
jgi:hypothetical protein